VITAVLDKSSEPGLTSLLPRKGTYFEPRQPASPADVRPNIYSVPHLPLTPTWQEANFSLSSLFPSWNGLSDEGVDIQSWTVDLLGRYRYSLGSSPSHFTSIRSTFSMNSLEKYLDANEQLALLALNDE
jgi:3-O-alpha-D-mannopyranosyl-alpha-D-mannopyranose xylosylphosphotransferase